MSKQVQVAVGLALALVQVAGCRRGESLEFTGLPPAASDAEKRSVRLTSSAEVGSSVVQKSFQTLLRSGQHVGDF